MASLKELIAQKEALEAEIERTRSQDRSDAIAKVRDLMEQYGLTPADFSGRAGAKLRGGKGERASKGMKVAPKYRDKSTGETWSGRGLQPKWLKAALASGRKLTDFSI